MDYYGFSFMSDTVVATTKWILNYGHIEILLQHYLKFSSAYAKRVNILIGRFNTHSKNMGSRGCIRYGYNWSRRINYRCNNDLSYLNMQRNVNP